MFIVHLHDQPHFLKMGTAVPPPRCEQQISRWLNCGKRIHNLRLIQIRRWLNSGKRVIPAIYTGQKDPSSLQYTACSATWNLKFIQTRSSFCRPLQLLADIQTRCKPANNRDMGVDHVNKANCIASGRGRTVCVTGASGFKAYWLTHSLRDRRTVSNKHIKAYWLQTSQPIC
jgi:hypothetical protein